MEKLISIYKELHDAGVMMFSRRMNFSSGSMAATIESDGHYGLFLDTDAVGTTAEEAVTVAHEGGHIITGSTHRMYSPYELINAHENRANKWAIKKLVPEDELNEAVDEGRTQIWELAEYFNVTEAFMLLAVHWYKHGNMAMV